MNGSDISEKLHNYRFIPLGKIYYNKEGKKVIEGFEPGWQKNNYTLEEMKKKEFKNYGVVGDQHNIIIDIDKGPDFEEVSKAVEAFKETFTDATPSGGLHFFLNSKDKILGSRLGNSAGEIRAEGMMVIGPKSKTEEGKQWATIRNKTIATEPKEKIEKVLGKWMGSKVEDATVAPSKEPDHSRSGREYWELVKLIRKGFTKEKCFEKMKLYSKWNEAHPQYRETTYNNALNEKENIKPEKKAFSRGNFELKNIKYFDKLKKDKRYIVEDCIYPDTVNMLYSPPAQFKSLAAMHLGMQIATGKKFMGLKTKKQAVLLCDKENNEQIIKNRIKRMRTGHKIKSKSFPLWFLTRNGDLLDGVFLDNLDNAIKENKIKLVIFDTLHRFADYDENSSNDINRLYIQVFQPILEKHDCSILFLHHTTKEGKYRGSSDLYGQIDTAWSIKRTGKTDKFKIINEKSRFGEIEELYGEIDFTDEAIQFQKLEADAEVTKPKFVEAVNKLKDLFLNKEGAWKKCDIMTDFSIRIEKGELDLSLETVRKALEWGAKKNIFLKPKRGQYELNPTGDFDYEEKKPIVE